MPWNKYHAKKVIIDGIEFDSKKEGQRYQTLKLLESAGRIQNVKTQVGFLLVPSQKLTTPKVKNGRRIKTEKAVKYVADFTYEENGKLVVEDTKGVRTPEYVIKRKLMKYIHGIEIVEV